MGKKHFMEWTIIQPEGLEEEVKITKSPVLDLHVVTNNLHIKIKDENAITFLDVKPLLDSLQATNWRRASIEVFLCLPCCSANSEIRTTSRLECTSS